MMWGSVCPMHPELEGERYNGGNCPACTKITKAAYNERTREKRLAEMKAYKAKNAERAKQAMKDWADNNREKIQCSNPHRIGFTLKLKRECIEMQGGKCAICRVEFTTIPRRAVHADHCHKTMQPRGVLCHHCNAALGSFRDDPERMLRAIEYLKNPTLEPLV